MSINSPLFSPQKAATLNSHNLQALLNFVFLLTLISFPLYQEWEGEWTVTKLRRVYRILYWQA